MKQITKISENRVFYWAGDYSYNEKSEVDVFGASEWSVDIMDGTFVDSDAVDKVLSKIK